MCPTSWYCIKLQMHSAGNHHQRWWQLSLQLVLCIQQTRRLVICECWSFVSLLIIFTTYVLHFLIFIHIGLTWLCLLFLVFVYFYLRRLTSKVKIHKHKKRRQSHVRAIWFFFFFRLGLTSLYGNHHLIVVERFACPSEPGGYVVRSHVIPVGSPKANWSQVRGRTKYSSQRPHGR